MRSVAPLRSSVGTLRELHTAGCAIPDFAQLSDATCLQNVDATGATTVNVLWLVKSAPTLTRLSLSSCTHLRNLTPIADAPQLESVDLTNVHLTHGYAFKPVWPKLPDLRVGCVSSKTQTNDFSPLSFPQSCKRVASISPLSVLQEPRRASRVCAGVAGGHTDELSQAE